MRVVFSGLASFLTMFVAGGIWNAVVMKGYYSNHAPAIARAPEAQSMGWLLVAYLLLATFMTFLFSQSSRSRATAAEGFQFGALFGVIATLPLYLILFAVWDISLPFVLVDSGWHLVEEGLGGLVLALTLFRRQATAAT